MAVVDYRRDARRGFAVFMMFVLVGVASLLTVTAAWAADTCEGYDEKRDGLSEDGTATEPVHNSAGQQIGTITYDNVSEPERVTWDVDDGYSLEVCVKGGNGIRTGSGEEGTVYPPKNKGGNTPAVSHYAWTVNTETPVVTETETEDEKKEKTEDTVVKDKKSEDEDVKDKRSEDVKDKKTGDTDVKDTVGNREPEESDQEVAVLEGGGTPQVAQVPQGGASTGGGSTSGVENAELFVLGLLLMGAAGPVLMVGRRVSRRR